MKKLIQGIISLIAQSDAGWRVLDLLLVRPARFAQRARRQVPGGKPHSDLKRRALAKVAPNGFVRHGPFQDMRYPELRAIGSSLFAKLLGCYEGELSPHIERLCTVPYTDIVDIGCAEGYYAVGFAMRIPSAIVSPDA